MRELFTIDRRRTRFAAGLVAALFIASCGAATAEAPATSAAARATLATAASAAASAASSTAVASATPAASAAPSAAATASAAAAAASSVAATPAPGTPAADTATPAPATPAPATAVPATPAPVPATPAPATSRTVNVTLTDTSIVLSQSSAPAGPVTFVIKNVGYVTHELVVLQTSIPQDQLPVDPTNSKLVQQPGVVGQASNIAVGATATLTLTLAAGPYDLICNLANHYHDGMHVGFTVTP